MTAIFISYRRSTSEHLTDRMARELGDRFGDDAVFLDRRMHPGVRWDRETQNALRTCRVLIAVVCRDWAPRLAAPGDYVRDELEAVLKRGAPIIPVRTGVPFPAADTLPPSLRALAFHQGLEVRAHPHVESDLELLAEALHTTHGIPLAPGWTAKARATQRSRGAAGRDCRDALAARRFAPAAECLRELLRDAPADAHANLCMAVARIGGRSPRTLSSREVVEVEDHLAAAAADAGTAATALYLLAVVKHDHHYLNRLHAVPTFVEVVQRFRSADPERLDRELAALVPASPRIAQALGAAPANAP